MKRAYQILTPKRMINREYHVFFQKIKFKHMKNIFFISLFFFILGVKAQETVIVGNWQLTKVIDNGETQSGFRAVFIFEKQGILKAARSTGENSMHVGSWEYNSKSKTLTMKSDVDKDFRGEAKVLKINQNTLVYLKDKVEMTFSRISDEKMKPLEPVSKNKPELGFIEADFWNENDEALGTIEELITKLPWKFNEVATYLKQYKDVIYTVSNFRGDNPPDTFIVSERIAYNEIENSIDVRDYSISNNDYIEMTTNEIPLEQMNAMDLEDQFHFYPADELDPFRVVGVEKIDTILGELECTVVEGFNSYSNKIKYWLINEKPGIYAKVIIVNPSEAPFGYANIKVLKAIK